VVDSIKTELGGAPFNAPSSPSQTSRDAASSATILKVTWERDAASRGESAMNAPALTKGTHFSRLRFKMANGKFAESRRLAMPEPMMPSPRIATLGFDIVFLIPKE
jgi:hypothetical protein